MERLKSFYIKKFSTRIPNGYNDTDGGPGLPGFKPMNISKRRMSDNAPKRFRSNNPNYGVIASFRTRLKLSEAHKGKKHSEKTKRKIRLSKLGKKNPMFGRRGKSNPFYGRKHSIETKIRISEANKGKHLSKETIRKIAKASKGRHHSKQTIMKCSIAKLGKKNPMFGKFGENNPGYGRNHSIEARKNMRKAQRLRRLRESVNSKR